ncbi:PhzF family phenazine biosynthesis isomerase [Iocasia frigidifontis]|uniref:PhzF family phenazine biosynthesis isomerase n=1 Tax=Iocasia fonsfrigidae TaxID=2682810 RepID=A0A8A7KEG9_9FIRM|nr:PhzF family phenazine biosynthesis protein [Iocasia fonsfrigidae]AZO94914.1 PhzF family phenazine biosynthesis protein [Halocella sp. SP3-1]QTL97839.1 PhzF family phenazine biosynthesis isomerase [Iocasia fonsfrigidae]
MTNMIYKATAFTEDINGGNPAGVVLNADSLNEEQMLNIAKKIGYSETAFIMKSSKADFRIRFFTPVDEVDLCGHAIVATFNLLRDLSIINIGDYIQETKAGVLKIKIQERCIYMEQNTPEYFELIHKDEIENCFKSSVKNYISDMPIQVVSTGLKDIILPVKDLKTLFCLKPNIQKIEEISKKYNVVGIHAFSLDTINGCEAHTRNFAPRYGIDEESATGTSNGALACYLMNYLRNKFNGNFTIEQGYSMKRPSKIKVQLKYDGNKINEVYVGGSAVIISSNRYFP